jgi:hypothetical protein
MVATWEDIGIIDPEIKWPGKKTGPSDDTAELFEHTMMEIELYRDDIDDMRDAELWSNYLDALEEWIDHIKEITAESAAYTNFREKLVTARSELIKFKKKFEDFAVSIGWDNIIAQRDFEDDDDDIGCFTEDDDDEERPWN